MRRCKDVKVFEEEPFAQTRSRKRRDTGYNMENMGHLWKIYGKYGTSMEHMENLCFFVKTMGNLLEILGKSMENAFVFGQTLKSMDFFWKT